MMDMEQFKEEAAAEESAIHRILMEWLNSEKRWDVAVNACRRINPTLDKYAIRCFLKCLMDGREGDFALEVRRHKAAWELAGDAIKWCSRKDFSTE
jgi:hypothetical protein